MEFINKQICLSISLIIFTIEFIFFYWVKHHIPKEIHEDPIINQLQQFFNNVTLRHITYYIFVYCLILIMCKFYQAMFIILLIIQSISTIVNIIVYQKLSKKN